MKKSNHSKKIVKQLKKEYKEDLEKSGVKQDVRSGWMPPPRMSCNVTSVTLRYFDTVQSAAVPFGPK